MPTLPYPHWMKGILLVFVLLLAAGSCRYPAPQLAAGDSPKQRAWRAACNQGDAVSCRKLGQSILVGPKSDESVRLALGLLERGCEAKDPESCAEAGRLYVEVPALEARSRGVARLEAACAAGVGKACQWLGDTLWERRTEVGMPSRILGLYERGCSLQHGGSCAQVGYVILGDEFSLIVKGEWYEWLDRGCNLDELDACYVLATRATSSSDDAFRWAPSLLERTCGKGHSQACATYATWLAAGAKVKKDCPKVQQLAARPCYENHADACAALAWCGDAQEHAFGKSVKRTSDDLLSEACQVGSAFGCYHLAARLVGLEQPDAEAIATAAKAQTADESRPSRLMAVLGRACDEGSMDGCLALATAWVGGRTEASRQSGTQLLRRLCDAGNGKACLIAGRAYQAGEIVPKDLTLANELFWRACHEGEHQGCDYRPTPPQNPTPAPSPK